MHDHEAQNPPFVAGGDLVLKHLPAERWWKRPRWQVAQMFDLLGHRVYAGFITDGASIPRLFWFLFSPIGNHMKAAVLHDSMLQSKDLSYSERTAIDKTFYQAMLKSGVMKWRAYTMWKAVRVWYHCKHPVTTIKQVASWIKAKVRRT